MGTPLRLILFLLSAPVAAAASPAQAGEQPPPQAAPAREQPQAKEQAPLFDPERERQAQEAYAALARTIPSRRTDTHQERVEFFREVDAKFRAFLEDWGDTLVGWQVRISLGNMQTNVLGNHGEAALLLGESYRELQALRERLPADFPMPVDDVGLYYLMALVKAENFTAARETAEKLAASETPQAQIAKQWLERIPRLERVRTGQPCPAFEVEDWGGEKLSPGQYRGKVVLLDFWASTIGSCIGEIPILAALHDRYGAQGFAVIGVNLDQEGLAEHLHAFADQHRMTWRLTYSGKALSDPLAELFVVDAIPESVVLDRRGVIRYRGVRGDALEQAVAALLAEQDEPAAPQKTEQ